MSRQANIEFYSQLNCWVKQNILRMFSLSLNINIFSGNLAKLCWSEALLSTHALKEDERIWMITLDYSSNRANISIVYREWRSSFWCSFILGILNNGKLSNKPIYDERITLKPAIVYTWLPQKESVRVVWQHQSHMVIRVILNRLSVGSSGCRSSAERYGHTSHIK